MKSILVTPGKVLNNNEHLKILYGILEKQGYQAAPWSFIRFIKADEEIIWHIHWTDEFYRGTLLSKGIKNHHSWLAGLRFLSFLFIFSLAKLKGIRIIWSIHNVMSNQEKAKFLQKIVYRILMRYADTVTAYNNYIKEQMACYGKREIKLMRRGGYEREYLDTVDKANARAKLDIPDDAFVFLLFGHILPYKGVDILVKAFQNYQAEDTYLIIAGTTHRDPTYGKKIHSLIKQDKRIRFFDKYIEPNEVQYYFRASDYTIYPYREVSHSGVLFLSITFGIPFIVSDKGGVSEILDLAPHAGVLINSNGEKDILAALDEARNKPKDDTAKAIACLEQEFRWEKIEQEIFAVFS